MKTKTHQINQITRFTLAAALALSIISCREKEKEPEGDFGSGVIVVNQGNFTNNNGTLSHYNREDATSRDDIFRVANGQSLNASLQAYAEAGNSGIILADHSESGRDRVEIVDKYTFKKLATLSAPDIENPVDVIAVNDNKAYVSCWGVTGVFPEFYINPGYIVVIDLSSNTVIKKIQLEKGSDKMVKAGSLVYVGSSGLFSNMMVIDTKTDEVIKQVNVGPTPKPIGLDANGKMWANSETRLYKLNAATHTIENTLPVGNDLTKIVGNFVFSPDRSNLIFNYYSYNNSGNATGETISLPVASNEVNLSAPIIKRTFNSMDVDPMQGLIYGSVVPSFTQGGYMVRYYINGDLKDSVKVGVAPRQAVFK